MDGLTIKHRITRDKPKALSETIAPNQVWLIDVMSDSLIDGQTLRAFNSPDDYSREGLDMEFGQSLPRA